MTSLDTPVFIVHGLRGGPLSNVVMAGKLARRGFRRIYRINYASSTQTLVDCRKQVADQIKTHLREPDEEIIAIGHCMGGLIVRHLDEEGIKIALGFMISTPQAGCVLGEYGKQTVPKFADWYLGISGQDMLQMEMAEPNFDYYTIGSHYFHRDSDLVVRCENMYIDEDRHLHLERVPHNLITAQSEVIDFIVEKSVPHVENWSSARLTKKRVQTNRTRTHAPTRSGKLPKRVAAAIEKKKKLREKRAKTAGEK